MDDLLTLLGFFFFMFLVIAAAVEVVIEMFRGVLERFGITWARSKVSLEEALAFAKEFAPSGGDFELRLAALRTVSEQMKKQGSDKIERIAAIRTSLAAAGADTAAMATELASISAAVRSALENDERQRVFLLRLLSAAVGCLLVWQADFHVFAILAQSSDVKAMMPSVSGLEAEWINVLVGGLAAAAGSSFWHDQLDRIRNLKSALADIRKLPGKAV